MLTSLEWENSLHFVYAIARAWVACLPQFTNYLLVMLLVAGGLAFLGWGLNTSDSSNVILGEGGHTIDILGEGVSRLYAALSLLLVSPPLPSVLGGTLLVLVFLTGCINYNAERTTANVLASIKNLLPSKTKVVRDGHEVTIPADDLVIGDLVHREYYCSVRKMMGAF